MPLNRISLSIAFLLAVLVGSPVAQASTCPAHNVLSTPTADFTVDNANQVVTHIKTGLMWKQCAEGLSGAGCATGTATYMVWNQAVSAAVTPFASYGDWRLPNQKELESIGETGCYSMGINEVVFPGTPAPYFWSSTSESAAPDGALTVDFTDGSGSNDVKTNQHFVRLVRSGQPFDSFDARKGTLNFGTIVPLNDTGQSPCYDSTGTAISCTTTGADDGRYGRDAAHNAGALTKIGAGAAGFDFTKIANNGSTLAAGAALGTASAAWACTKDNVTGLTWEVKTTTNTDLRYTGHAYTWYDSVGGAGSAPCNATLAGGVCNTQAYVAAVNAGSGLCGATDWRLPSLRELESLLDFSVSSAGSAMIEANYFPNTQIAAEYRTSNNYAPNSLTNAWVVDFDRGFAGPAYKTYYYFVRLVRGAQ